MKRVDKRLLTKRLMAAEPDLYQVGNLIVKVPLGRVLRGFYLENSSDSSRIYVWVFVQPLYAPSSTVSFNLGKRLGGPSRTWSLDDAEALVMAVREEGLPYIGQISSPADLANWCELHSSTDPYSVEARAYSLVADGRFAEGSRALEELASNLSSQVGWMAEIKERASQLATRLRKDPHAALDLLSTWEVFTIASLGIQDAPS